LGVGDPLVRLIHRAGRDEDRQLAEISRERRIEPEEFAEITGALRQRRVVHERGDRAAHGAALGRDLVVDAPGLGGQRVERFGQSGHGGNSYRAAAAVSGSWSTTTVLCTAGE